MVGATDKEYRAAHSVALLWRCTPHHIEEAQQGEEIEQALRHAYISGSMLTSAAACLHHQQHAYRTRRFTKAAKDRGMLPVNKFPPSDLAPCKGGVEGVP